MNHGQVIWMTPIKVLWQWTAGHMAYPFPVHMRELFIITRDSADA